MHDGSEIVRSGIVSRRVEVVELSVAPLVDVVVEDGNVLIAIVTLLLVPQPGRVPDLVDNLAGAASRRQQNGLFAAHHTHGGRAGYFARSRGETHVIRLV